MKLTSTAFPDGTRIDHNKQDVNVEMLVDEYRHNKASERSKELIKQAEHLNLNTRNETIR